jgi:hypothetical protein
MTTTFFKVDKAGHTRTLIITEWQLATCTVKHVPHSHISPLATWMCCSSTSWVLL